MIQTDAPDLLQLQNFLTYRMARVQARLNAQGMRYLKEKAGISLTQWRVIAMIGSGGEDTVMASELKRMMGFDKGMFSRTVKQLMEVGLLTSGTDETDHRRQRLALTADGRALYQKTLPLMRERQQRLRDAIGEQDLAVFFSALEKLEAAVEQEDVE